MDYKNLKIVRFHGGHQVLDTVLSTIEFTGTLEECKAFCELSMIDEEDED